MDEAQDRFGWDGDVEMANHTRHQRKANETKSGAVLSCLPLFHSFPVCSVPPAENPPKPPERTRIGHAIRIHSSAAPHLSCFPRLSTLPTRCYYFSFSVSPVTNENELIAYFSPVLRRAPLMAPSQNRKGSATHRDQPGPKTHTNQYRYTRAMYYINTAPPHPLSQQKPPRPPSA